MNSKLLTQTNSLLRRSLILFAIFTSPIYLQGCGDGGNDDDVNIDVDYGTKKDTIRDTVVVIDKEPVDKPDTVIVEDPEPGDDKGADFEGTTRNSSGRSTLKGNGWPALTSITTGSREGFDRVVFEFSSPGMTGIPAYDLEYIDKPTHDCGSGQERFLAGDGWLQVHFHGVNAHTEQGQPTVRNRDQKLSLPNLVQLTSTCDFAAEVIWVLGLNNPAEYRVLTLTNPSRLVVDVKHR